MASGLQFNGYYFSFCKKEDLTDSYNSVLRFFKDKNLVISVSCGKQKYGQNIILDTITLNEFFPKESWFNENFNNKGTYEISGNHIKFKCGFVSYEGTILENSLELFSHSDYNGYECNHIYKFISFDELQSEKINLLQYLAANNWDTYLRDFISIIMGIISNYFLKYWLMWNMNKNFLYFNLVFINNKDIIY